MGLDFNILNNIKDILNNSLGFHIERIDEDEEYMNEIVHHLSEQVPEIENIYNFSEVYVCAVLLKKDVYQEQVAESFGLDFIKIDVNIFITTFGENNEKVLIYQIEKEFEEKVVKRKRKTLKELELSLKEAVDNEEYELARKIQNKIDIKQKNKPLK